MPRATTPEEFIQKAKTIHGDTYDYSQCIYVSSRKSVKIICRKHGLFEQNASNHLHGYGCWQCRKTRGGPNFSEFLERAQRHHGNKYDYKANSFKNVSSPISIICPEHGEFQQRGSDHLQGKGCRRCMFENLRDQNISNVMEFIAKANHKFGDLYDYSEVSYAGSKTPVKILCKKHGPFQAMPNNHLSGSGCPICANRPVSLISQKWLDYLNVPSEYREKWIQLPTGRIKVDAFDPMTNTVFEFWGDFWHGNPQIYDSKKVNYRCKKSYGTLYEDTMARRQLIIDAGYNLIDIWESDFKK